MATCQLCILSAFVCRCCMHCTEVLPRLRGCKGNQQHQLQRLMMVLAVEVRASGRVAQIVCRSRSALSDVVCVYWPAV